MQHTSSPGSYSSGSYSSFSKSLRRSVARRHLLLGVFTLLLTVGTSRQVSAESSTSPVGLWTTIDDDGKTPKAVVQIEQRGTKLFGKIVELIRPDRPNPKCDECEGALKGKPILGMQILWDLERDGDEWANGKILDPNNGKIYRCYIEVVEGGTQLKVRGYIGISLLGRTQYWRKGRPNG